MAATIYHHKKQIKVMQYFSILLRIDWGENIILAHALPDICATNDHLYVKFKCYLPASVCYI